MKRYCVKCQFEKPEEGFVCLSRGKFGKVKVHVCADCAARLKSIGSAAKRDAFGKESTKRNGTRLSIAAKLREQQKGQP